METPLPQTLENLDHLLRTTFDRLGCVEGERGSYRTGHRPDRAEMYYLCTRYPGLDEAELDNAQAECGRFLPQDYRSFLAHMNGVRIMGLSLHGATGGLLHRSTAGIGQPISLRYQNVVERPAYIPHGSLGIGAMNGPRFSQGMLYLASTGEIEMYEARSPRIGARWSSLAAFLSEEIPRYLAQHDSDGEPLVRAKLLPGDTDDWESRAEVAKKGRRSLRDRVKDWLFPT